MSIEAYIRTVRSPVSRSGDQLDIPIRLDHAPLVAREAATKGYVDGRVGGDAIRPYNVGRWYTHNAPGSAGTDLIQNWTQIAPMFVGRVATWSAIAISHGGGGGSWEVQLGIYGLNADTLYPETLLYAGPINTTMPASPYRNNFIPILGANLQTSYDWLGLAVHGGGGGGAFFTAHTDVCGAVFGQVPFREYGFTSGLTTAGGVALSTNGNDSQVPVDPNTPGFLPFSGIGLPRIGLLLASVP